jgi:hypothetical protein
MYVHRIGPRFYKGFSLHPFQSFFCLQLLLRNEIEAVDFEEPILQNSISAEKLSDKFVSSNFRQMSTQKQNM